MIFRAIHETLGRVQWASRLKAPAGTILSPYEVGMTWRAGRGEPEKDSTGQAQGVVCSRPLTPVYLTFMIHRHSVTSFFVVFNMREIM